MHISIVAIADLPEGGGNTSRLRMLAQALVHSGHRVSIWNEHALGVADDETLEAEGKLDGTPFRFALGTTSRSSGFRSLPEKLRAVRIIGRWVDDARRRNELDVLWFNNLSFYDTWWLTRKARRLGIRTVQSYEDERQELVSRDGVSFSRRFFALNSSLGDGICPREADAVVVISEYLRHKYERLGVDPAKIHTVPTIIDCRAWDRPAKPADGPPLILYAGAFGEQDAMDELVEALDLLKKKALAFRAVFLGGNRRESDRVDRIRSAIGRLGLSDLVEMPGFVPRAKVWEWLGQADILVNIRKDGPWAQSGLSTKLSEYLATGRVVLASRVGDVSRYLSDRESVVLLSPAPDAREIAAALEQTIASPEERRRIGRGGQEVARRHFDLPVVAKQLQDVLGSLSMNHGIPAS